MELQIELKNMTKVNPEWQKEAQELYKTYDK
jgi:hypothetical protein